MQFDRCYLAPSRHRRREGARRLEDPYILVHEKKLGDLPALLPILEGVVQSDKATDDLGGCGGRGAGDADRQAAARRLQGRGRQGAGFGDRRKAIWKKSGPGRRPDDLRGPWHQARERHDRDARAGKAHADRGGNDHDHRRGRRQGGHFGAHPGDQGAVEETTSTTTRRSCRSVWRSSPAASRSFASAARPKRRSRKRRIVSTMR